MNKTIRLSKAILLACAASMLLIPCSPIPGIAAAESSRSAENVLIAYDSLALGTPNEGNVEALLRLLSAMGVPAALKRLSDDEALSLSHYQAVIAVRNVPELDGGYSKLSEALAGYEGLFMHVGAGMEQPRAALLRLREGRTEPETARLDAGPLRHAAFVSSLERLPYIAFAEGNKHGEIRMSGSGRTTPFGVSGGSTAYVPVFRAGGPSCVAMGYLLRDWLGLNGEGNVYLLYKEIYPFPDLQRLNAVSGALYEHGIPYIYSVRPVYRNLDYPAMQRYMEMLRIAQSRNGSIFAGASVLSPAAGIQAGMLEEKTALFLNVLAENGIVALGTGADAAYWWREDMGYSEHGMDPFDSAVLFAPADPALLAGAGALPTRAFGSSMLSVSWDDIAPYWLEPSAALPVDLAITLDFYTTTEQMSESIRKLRASGIPFADYKNGRHETRTERHSMASEGGILYIDGEQIGLARTAGSVSPEFDYREEGPASFERLFTVQNYFYLTVIVCALAVFGVILLAGRRLYRRKYLKGGGDDAS
jgi:uncharacterized protein YdaL